MTTAVITTVRDAATDVLAGYGLSLSDVPAVDAYVFALEAGSAPDTARAVVRLTCEEQAEAVCRATGRTKVDAYLDELESQLATASDWIADINARLG